MADAQQAQALARIGDDALHAGHVLTQLLALARAGRTMLSEPPTPVDLAALARQAAADHAGQAWQRDCQIEVQAPPVLWVAGNAVLLELALRNLVENALKHTPSHTRVVLQCGQESGSDQVWLQVCDDGRRHGGPAAPVAVDSLHLGHEIVAQVAQAHRGRFAAAPAPQGLTTCYRMELPATQAPSAG